MDLYFVQEAIYYRYGGQYYSPRINYNTYWSRYLKHFKTVNVIARVQEIAVLPNNYLKASGDNVHFIEIPFYNGLLSYLKINSSIKKILGKHLHKDVAYVLRLPGLIGSLMSKRLRSKQIAYAVEVVGDPYEVSKFLKMPFLFRFGLMNFSLHQTRRAIKNSIAALYVTTEALQKRYPIGTNKISSSASNVILESKYFVNKGNKRVDGISLENRLNDHSQPPVRIGVLGMMYEIKSPLDILKAVDKLIKEGLNVELFYAGDGPSINDVEKTSIKMDISNKVHCLGNLANGEDVFKFLDSLDLYVQFSKTEGMPRAMLEAMARGCAVISSDVGGIPEIVSPQFLVESGNIKMLSKKIRLILSSQNMYKQSVEENFSTSQQFSVASLDKKRSDYYSEVYQMFKRINNKI